MYGRALVGGVGGRGRGEEREESGTAVPRGKDVCARLSPLAPLLCGQKAAMAAMAVARQGRAPMHSTCRLPARGRALARRRADVPACCTLGSRADMHWRIPGRCPG